MEHMENIANEVRAYQEQYWAEESAREAQREANKKVNPKKAARVMAALRKPSSASKIERIAKKRFGMDVATGGREGTYLVADNRTRWPLTYHPGDLARGTQNAIRKFILQGGAPSARVAAG